MYTFLSKKSENTPQSFYNDKHAFLHCSLFTILVNLYHRIQLHF